MPAFVMIGIGVGLRNPGSLKAMIRMGGAVTGHRKLGDKQCRKHPQGYNVFKLHTF